MCSFIGVSARNLFVDLNGSRASEVMPRLPFLLPLPETFQKDSFLGANWLVLSFLHPLRTLKLTLLTHSLS